jgi:pantetheine-phosphate adenylyltransferase
MSKKAIYPGTFDPITKGHVDIVRRAACLFDEVLVAVAESTSKNTVFSTQERIEMAEIALQQISNAKVVAFNGLMADCAREHQAKIILRGLRAVSDFEYEFQMASMNRKLIPEADTLFLTPAEQFSYISSSLVRDIAKYGGDVAEFVPENVLLALNERFAES